MRLLILPILYFLSVELILVKPSLFFWVALALAAASILAVFQISKKRRSFSVICPLMFLVGSFLILPLIGGKIIIHFYAVLASIVFWFSFLQLRLFFSSQERLLKISLDLGKSINLVACFLWFSGIYGLYTNFSLPPILVTFLGVLTVSLLGFHFLKLSLFSSTQEKVNHSSGLEFIFILLVIDIAILEILWVLLFWPFFYLTTGAVLVIIYYVALDIWQSRFRKVLSKRLIVNRLILSSVLVTLVLATTKWLPL